jgi:hypothetical protein
MKKFYEELELDVIRFGAADILTASAAEETSEETTDNTDETPVDEQGDTQQQQIWGGRPGVQEQHVEKQQKESQVQE